MNAFVSSSDLSLCAGFADLLHAPEHWPFSFQLGETLFHGLPGATLCIRRVSSELLESEAVLSVGSVEVCAKVQIWQDYPAVEWTLYFTNRGNAASPRLSGVNAMDCAFTGDAPVLVTNNGDFYSEKGYSELHQFLSSGESVALHPEGGRACDGAFPYQRLLFVDYGVMIAEGWPGKWKAEFRCADGKVLCTAGQYRLDSVILPGETLRSPRISLLFFVGDETRGINLWRRWFRAHVMPRCDGMPIGPQLTTCDNNGGIEWTASTEKGQLDAIAYAKEHYPEANLWWIDAGWYPCLNDNGEPRWSRTGDWRPDPARYPNGFAPIGKACADAGMDMLVWFEPERVHPASVLAKEHPDWLLPHRTPKEMNGASFLLDLTNDDCFEWLCAKIGDLIRDSGIRWYRQDFNFDPLELWEADETNDRVGATENRYVQRYLAYWDRLLTDHPGLKIDSCASGGRRNDLETMRRAVPLHPTDYGYGYHHINQAFRRVLYSWFPFTRSWTASWDKDNEYYDHSDYYAAEHPTCDNFEYINGCGVFSTLGAVPVLQAHEESAGFFHQMADLMLRFGEIALYGDYYPLTPDHRDNKQWTVFQFDDGERNRGVLQCLRNNQAAEAEVIVYPKGLDPEGAYRFTNPETGECREQSGVSLLSSGFRLSQPVRSGALWFYSRI